MDAFILRKIIATIKWFIHTRKKKKKKKKKKKVLARASNHLSVTSRKNNG